MSETNYWRDMIAETLDEHGITATPDQIANVAADVAVCKENYADPCAPPCEPSSMQREIDEANRKLQQERAKITCRSCGGAGELTEACGTFFSRSECWKCRGEGRHTP